MSKAGTNQFEWATSVLCARPKHGFPLRTTISISFARQDARGGLGLGGDLPSGGRLRMTRGEAVLPERLFTRTPFPSR